jgi:hypothetical protein
LNNFTSSAFVKTGYQEEHKHYIGSFDFLLLDPAHRLPTPPMPDVSLLSFKSNENMFNANVSHESIRPDQIDWLPDDTVLIYRQYLANYYHIIMDDMIAIWWTLVHHHSPAAAAAGDPPRNLQFLLLDDNAKSGIDIDAMFAVLSNKPILTRADLHKRNKLVCIRRAIVGASERSYGGPGRRFITDALLRQFHQHLRSGAFKSFDEAAGTTTTTTTEPPSKIRIAMLFRSGQRVVLNEAEVMQGLRDAFPSAEVFEYRPDDMTFEGQVSAMRNSTVLIGVHGAGLTNLMFLPSGASVVEILPWHWERHAYERMSVILGYTYGKWANTDRSATVFPEEQTWKHFPATSEEDRAAIRNADSKPMNLRGIAGLAAEKYWINQDTRVNVAEFVQVVRKTMQNSALNAALLQLDNSNNRRDEL